MAVSPVAVNIARLRQRALSQWPSLLLFATPAVATGAMYELPEALVQRIVVAVLGVLAIAYLSSRPGPTATCLVGGFVVMEIVLPLLYRFGLPAPAVRFLGYWKEGLAVALLAAAVRYRRRHPAPIDAVDVLGVLFALIATLYWAFPTLFPPDGTTVPGAARQVAFRGYALPVVALLAARHAGIPESWRRRCLGAAVFAGALLGLGAIVEIAAPGWWDDFLGSTIGVLPYQQAVRNVTRSTVLTYADFQLGQQQRAGTWYADPLIAGFTYHLPIAAALTMALLRPRLWLVGALGLAGAGMLFTQGRAAILGSVLIVVAAFRHRDRSWSLTRTKIGLIVAALSIVALPLLAGTGLGARIAGAVNGDDDVSAPVHIERTQAAFDLVVAEPLGHGIGLAGGNSQRFQVQGAVLSENHFLAVGIDIGVAGMVAFVLLVAAVVRVGRRARGDPVAFAAISAVVATAFGGLFLHSFESPLVSVPCFIAAGLAIAPETREALPEPLPTSERAADRGARLVRPRHA